MRRTFPGKTRFVEHERCIDIEVYYRLEWIVISCSTTFAKWSLREGIEQPTWTKMIAPTGQQSSTRRYYEINRKAILARQARDRKALRSVTANDYYTKYGITRDIYNEMAKTQGGKCALCGKTPAKLLVDHDHQTGQVRGLLCTSCNIGLGHLQDSPTMLDSAAAYIRRFRPD